MDDGADRLSAVFSALADPTRRAILAELAQGDASVTELAAPLPMSMPAVSRHLKVLEQAALISRTRSGKVRGSHLEPAPLREQEIDSLVRAYATGRRKDAVARVWLKPGTGKITINGRDFETYFARPSLRLVINQVFGVAEREGQYDVVATVKGGGLSGQAGAVKHGISQAITKYEPILRTQVKRAGMCCATSTGAGKSTGSCASRSSRVRGPPVDTPIRTRSAEASTALPRATCSRWSGRASTLTRS